MFDTEAEALQNAEEYTSMSGEDKITIVCLEQVATTRYQRKFVKV